MLNAQGIIDHITAWLGDYCKRAGQQGFVIGISGGVDSAVVSTLCARTGLPLLCLEMPIHQPPAHVGRAQEHIAWLKQHYPAVSSRTVDLSATFDQLAKVLPPGNDPAQHALALANTRSRLRMATLYYFAGLQRLLVAGTGNKIEDFGVGFFTKYGDGGVDLSPIGDLTKTDVFALAQQLGIVQSIRQAVPSDGLFTDDRSDEAQLGASYPELEWAMALRDSGAEVDESGLDARQREVLQIYDRLHRANSHKWLPVPVCVLPGKLRK